MCAADALLDDAGFAQGSLMVRERRAADLQTRSTMQFGAGCVAYDREGPDRSQTDWIGEGREHLRQPKVCSRRVPFVNDVGHG